VFHACSNYFLVFINPQQVIPFQVGGSKKMWILGNNLASTEDT
jgi:hypothetical protein